jgi:hypothetical protein
VAKLFATSTTLGSGASGGVFSPALFLGAMAGEAWGVVLNHYLPGLQVSPVAFAVAGMGGVVGGTTAAAMAAIVMIFEMTLDYTVILPMTLTVAVSYGLRRILIKDSIYTRKLTLRGETAPETLRADVEALRRAEEVMHPLSPEMAAAYLGEESQKHYVLVRRSATLNEVIAKLRASGAAIAIVAAKDRDLEIGDLQGTITNQDIVDSMADDLDLFGG